MEEELKEHKRILDILHEEYIKLDNIIKNYIKLKEELNQLPTEIFSEEDKLKINKLKELYIENIIKFGFGSSIKPDIDISLDNYLPMHKKFQKSKDLSATDQIRKIWAYSLAHLELSNLYETNHLKIIFFDEPAQQQINQNDLHSFYKKILSLNLKNSQIFLATSVEFKFLESIINNPYVNCLEIKNKLIIPLNHN